MIETIVIKEYEQLDIREKRDLSRKIISREDALSLQSIIMNEEPVFIWGYKKLIAQHWVGTISLKNLNIEILPKLYGHVSSNQLRNVLLQMIIISNQSPSVREIPGMVQSKKNSLIEMIIDTFLNNLERYINGGIHHTYEKIRKNSSVIKGKILFPNQFTENVLNLTKFYCRFSKFTIDNELNRFFKICLVEMNRLSKDTINVNRIRRLLPFFESVTLLPNEKVLLKEIIFNSTNQRAETSYRYGLLFLKNIFSTLNSGNTSISMMLFNMESLFELFIYRITKMILGNNIIYQMRGNYLLERNYDSKKFINLIPDLTLRIDSSKIKIIDTKWKIPKNFIKESDSYQMNAYSSSIKNIDEVIILYPYVQNNQIIGTYTFIDIYGKKRILSIKTIDLMQISNWNLFLYELKKIVL